MHADVVIVGAGIHGSSSALSLARAGLSVMVLEQSYPGRHASGVNAGGVRRLGRHPAEIPLSDASMKIWHDMQSYVGDDCGFRRTGQIKVAESESELKTLGKRVDQVKKLGFDHEELIGLDELREWLPAVSDHCCGAILCRDDGCALPFQTVTSIRKAAEQAGAIFNLDNRVVSLKRRSGHWCVKTNTQQLEAATLINCAGAWGGQIANLLGEEVPVSVEAPMLMITERVAAFCDPVVGAAGRPLSFKQFDNGTVLIGGGYRGTAYPDTQKTRLDMSGLSKSAATAEAIFPILKGVRVNRCWAGIEAVMPDQIPVISASARWPNAYHVFGFSAHGFQLGPITGTIISDLILNGSTALPIGPFSIKRFLSDIE